MKREIEPLDTTRAAAYELWMKAPIKEFYILPVGDKLIQYDAIAVNTIVKNKNNEVSSCDIRQCALNRNVETCGSCNEMETCEKLGAIIGNNTDAYRNLKR